MTAYLLKWELFNEEPDGTVCRLVEFDGWDSNRLLARVWPPFRPSEPVEFDTNFALLEDVPDYPNNTARWPLMSRRMLDVLLSVREFGYHEVPVTLVQDTIPVDIRYDAQGRPKPEYSRSDYLGLQLANDSDFLDIERSTYTPLEFAPKSLGLVTRFVFKEPEEGFPPIFRVKESTNLFVSAEARVALESAGIRGPVYTPLSRVY